MITVLLPPSDPMLLHGLQAAFCGRIPHELGKEKRVAVLLGLYGPFSGGYAASRRRAGLLAAWKTGESHDWILFGGSNPLS
jgi:hypothetical protein